MLCQTIRPNTECFFWKAKKGCTFEGGQCYEIVEKCEGCEHIVEFSGKKMCAKYPKPADKWLSGPCTMATHIKIEVKKEEPKPINPLKASKRMARRK